MSAKCRHLSIEPLSLKVRSFKDNRLILILQNPTQNYLPTLQFLMQKTGCGSQNFEVNKAGGAWGGRRDSGCAI
jgi:hypothetical protein